MTEDDVRKLVSLELSSFRDGYLREQVEKLVVSPLPQERLFEWSEKEIPYTIWIVCETNVENVAIAYTDGGFARDGFPWGLVFRDQKGSGPPNCWYRTFDACVSDSTCF